MIQIQEKETKKLQYKVNRRPKKKEIQGYVRLNEMKGVRYRDKEWLQ